MHEVGDSCVASATSNPGFDLTSFLSGAFKIGCDVDYMPGINALQAGSPKSSTQPSPTSSDCAIRKRRRGEVANPANTLDGLVARRADDGREPYQKRYLSEQEAIEGPDDELEMKRMEKDPDVSTRTCSTCGYQGKWVSEMIRHKRVHTSERPFKCRYCSRTSKWKADLIRHVAKTHGIRVVSKYSRSKTFDPSTTNLVNRAEEDKPKVFACEKPDRQRQPSPTTSDSSSTSTSSANSSTILRPEPVAKSPLSYRCVLCLFEQDGLSVMLNHLHNVHNVLPYECRCGNQFINIDAALAHAKAENCNSGDLIVHITPIYNRGKTMTASVTSMEDLSPTGSSSDSSPETERQLEIEEDFERNCLKCPYQTSSDDQMRRHEEGHQVPRTFLSYKCAFCPYYSKKKTEIEVHMRLHTPYPQQFMASVERNMVTPLSLGLNTSSLMQPLLTSVPEATTPISTTSPSALDLTNALLALDRLATNGNSYLATMNCLLSTMTNGFQIPSTASTNNSAFTPVGSSLLNSISQLNTC
ncbi:unnamed protein product [Auanema sp. JU1783]|nr:unnamed protein product [Auanema sp. JU1783]